METHFEKEDLDLDLDVEVEEEEEIKLGDYLSEEYPPFLGLEYPPMDSVVPGATGHSQVVDFDFVDSLKSHFLHNLGHIISVSIVYFYDRFLFLMFVNGIFLGYSLILLKWE